MSLFMLGGLFWKNNEEKTAIESENEISKITGDILRDSHEGEFIQTTGPLSKTQDPNIDPSLKKDVSNTIDSNGSNPTVKIDEK